MDKILEEILRGGLDAFFTGMAAGLLIALLVSWLVDGRRVRRLRGEGYRDAVVCMTKYGYYYDRNGQLREVSVVDRGGEGGR